MDHTCVGTVAEPDTCMICGRTEKPDRPEPVDPSEVRVGDVVEIARAGKVDYADANAVTIRDEDGDYSHVQMTPGTTVRVLHRAQPEPDPAAVRVLAQVMRDSKPETAHIWDIEDWRIYARALLATGRVALQEVSDAD